MSIGIQRAFSSKPECGKCGHTNSEPRYKSICEKCGTPFRKKRWSQDNQNTSPMRFSRPLVVLSLCILVAVVYRGYQQSKYVSDVSKADWSNQSSLSTSEPVFSAEGIHFTLNDTRPNDSLWVTVRVGSVGEDKSFMTWISLSGIKPGMVSIPFRDFKYFDDGLEALTHSTKYKVIIGAKLKDTDKIVHTTYEAPISELRASLKNATN